MKQPGVDGIWNENVIFFISFESAPFCFSLVQITSCAGGGAVPVALTHDAITKRFWADSQLLAVYPVQRLFQEHSFSLCSRHRFYKILPLFLRLLTNTCLITISTVPFPTSKCLLLPLLQLHFAMSYCERGTEAAAHNIWQLYSCCAEKHPSHSKLQP